MKAQSLAPKVHGNAIYDSYNYFSLVIEIYYYKRLLHAHDDEHSIT